MPDTDERTEYVARAGQALAQVQAYLFDAWDSPDDYSIEEFGGPLDTIIEQSHALLKSIEEYVDSRVGGMSA